MGPPLRGHQTPLPSQAMCTNASLNMDQALCEHKGTSLGWELPTGEAPLCSKGPKCCPKTLPILTFFEVRGAGALGGWFPGGSGPRCGYSHLEDGRGLPVDVQDRVGVAPLVLGVLELVADLDSNVGEAVLFTELQSPGRRSCSWMWGRR